MPRSNFLERGSGPGPSYIDLNWMLLELGVPRHGRRRRGAVKEIPKPSQAKSQSHSHSHSQDYKLYIRAQSRRQTSWPHPANKLQTEAVASVAMVRLVYKYRNKHLKILLKLFHNLRLFDVSQCPASGQCSSSSSCFPIILACPSSIPSMCKFHCKATLFLLSLRKEFSNCNNNREKETARIPYQSPFPTSLFVCCEMCV